MRTPRTRTWWFIAAGLLVALLFAGGMSSFASSSPDGLDSVTREGCSYSGDKITGGECMARSAREHEVGGPLAGYSIAGIDNPYLATAVSGALGVVVVFGIGAGLFWLARRPARTAASSRRHPPDEADG